MSSIITIFAIILFANLASSMSIGYSETQTIDYSSDVPIQMSNGTIKKIYKIAEQVTNVTDTDSVLMQLQQVTPRSNDNLNNLMLLVVKNPNLTDSNIMERFNAYYIHTAKADPAESIISTIWNVMIISTRNYVMKRFKSMLQGMQILKPSSIDEAASSSAAAATTTGRSGAFPIVFRLHNEINNNNDQDKEPKVVLLIPEPFHLPDIASPNSRKEDDELLSKFNQNRRIITIPKTANSMAYGISPLRYMVRPIGAFTGLSVNAVDKTSTSVGTMITNTGLHFSLIGPSSGAANSKPKTLAMDFNSWRRYLRAVGHGFVIAKILG
ncbi:hypothetical protein DERF_003589 [Dermatophagoides farinae]|uniref:Uncharacterized protein n=1 Tax=Dermatophagoides farinae TaxID=6954 RepID=A0A922LAQ5_DERFA|nr:hypothetical protein DERF_003589 [Dermatophagoides farinae]